jgi:acetylornithine deacetylase/succinyl-diaminopimelate desuccinylase-like protein
MRAVGRALDRAGIRTRGDLIFLGTVQEELGLLGMSHWLDHNPDVADMVVVMDGGLGPVMYGALGIRWSRYVFRGEGSHTNTSAGKPHPARALADAIRSTYEVPIPPDRGGAVYNVGMLAGPRKPSGGRRGASEEAAAASAEPAYAGDPCPDCGHFTLVETGSELACEACEWSGPPPAP